MCVCDRAAVMLFCVHALIISMCQIFVNPAVRAEGGVRLVFLHWLNNPKGRSLQTETSAP